MALNALLEAFAMFDLNGKHAFITGGASGIGWAIAQRLQLAGAMITLCDLQAPTASLPHSEFLQTDVSNAESMQISLVQAASRQPIDVLINNAGINGEDGVDIIDSDLELTKRLFEVNTLGVYHGLKYGPEHMPSGSSIINTASLGASVVFPGSGPYSASKASVLSFTQMSAAELAPRKIRVNAVAPSFIRTPMAAEDIELFDRIGHYATLAGRIAEPEEVAAVYHFLASDDAAYINGQVINVDGGMSLGFTQAELALIAGGDT